MSELVHPSSRVGDAAPEPDIDGGYVVEETSRFVPAALERCQGPGPLLREYRWSPHMTCIETVEHCPECSGTMQHRSSRLVRLEDQPEFEQNRLPEGEVRHAG